MLASARLTTWEVSGPQLGRLSPQLQALPGIEQVTAFGNKLHVSGREAAAIERAIVPFRKGTLCLAEDRTGSGGRLYRPDADRARQFRMKRHGI